MSKIKKGDWVVYIGSEKDTDWGDAKWAEETGLLKRGQKYLVAQDEFYNGKHASVRIWTKKENGEDID